MNGKNMLALGIFILQMVFTATAHSALLAGARLTIDQGVGDCLWANQQYNCTGLAGSYVMGGWASPIVGLDSLSPTIVGFLNDGYDDMTGLFTGGPTAGVGLIIGVAQPYQGPSVGVDAPYDPSTGQNITSAFQAVFQGQPYPAWGTFYSTSAIVDNDGGTLDFTGWNMVWDVNPAIFGSGAYHYPPGDAVFTLMPGGAYGTGRYALNYFSKNCATGDFECQGILVHLEGSISLVPLPAAIWLFGPGLLGLVAVAKREIA